MSGRATQVDPRLENFLKDVRVRGGLLHTVFTFDDGTLESVSSGNTITELVVSLANSITSVEEERRNAFCQDEFPDEEDQHHYVKMVRSCVADMEEALRSHRWVLGRNDIESKDGEYMLSYVYNPNRNPWTWVLLPVGLFGPQYCWRSHSIDKLIKTVQFSHRNLLKKHPDYQEELEYLFVELRTYRNGNYRGLIAVVGGQDKWVLMNLK
jgi:hypothetical protein